MFRAVTGCRVRLIAGKPDGASQKIRGGATAAPAFIRHRFLSSELPLSDSAGKRRCSRFRAAGQAPS